MKRNERTYQQWKDLAERYFEAETTPEGKGAGLFPGYSPITEQRFRRAPCRYGLYGNGTRNTS